MLSVKSLEFFLLNDENYELDGVRASKYLAYKIIIKGRERIIKCPVFKIQERNCKEVSEGKLSTTPEKMIRCLPSFLIPRKKYPTYVYLYAIQYYLMNKISMRKVAEHVRSKFNLESFSHSTISRILKKFSHEKLEDTFPEAFISNVSPCFVSRKKWNESKQFKMQLISKILSDVLCSPEIIADKLCMEYFNKNDGVFLF